MGNTIDKARRWMIRKLGGVENTAIPKTEYRIMRTSMEHLRQRLVFSREESEYITPEFIQARLVHELADKIAGRVRIQKSGDDHYGDVVEGWKISRVKCYDKPKSPFDFGINRVPQSWCYVEEVL